MISQVKALPKLRLIFSLCLTLLSFALTGCGGDGGGSTCCTQSQCVDGALLKCHTGLADLTIEACPSGACNGNQCAIPQCPGVEGSTRCAPGSETNYLTCSAGNEVQLSCPSNTRCADGVCVETSCTVGEKKCGFNALLVCDDGTSWKVLDCENGQVCNDDGGDAGCADPVCPPGERGCLGDSVTVCQPNGAAYSTNDCGSGKTCRDGHCIRSICGQLPDTPDAGSSTDQTAINDGGNSIPDQLTIIDVPRNIPELKPLSKASVKINGESIVFTSGKDARWVTLGGEGSSNPDAQALQVVMSKGGRKIEILIIGVQENQVGQWTDADVAEVQAEIRWSDGFVENDRASSGCSTVGWTSCSQVYSVEISSFEPLGGRVTGIFEAELYDGTQLTEGSFDVERSQ